MSFVDDFLASPLAARLGWVFLHFLWQGALIAAALLFVTSWIGKSRPQARYLASCVALGLMLAAPIATFFWISVPDEALTPELLIAMLERDITLAGAEASDWRALVPVLAVFWLLGTFVQQARLFVQWWGAQRLKHSFHMPMPIEWQDYVASMKKRMGILVPVRVVESAVAEVPTVVGWLSPIVLVPTSALLQLSSDQLRMVLAHELAHIRRHDYLVNLVQTAVESLLFFHPAVWWISHRLRVEREYCCDDAAVALHGNALVYARALERLETLRVPREGDVRLAIASTGGSLMQRIQRLVRPESTARKSVTLGFLPAALLFAGALSSTAFGFANAGASSAQDEKEMSDDELERRIRELRGQIDRLEDRLHSLRGGRSDLRFDSRERHVTPEHEHDEDPDDHPRRFDVRFGDGEERTFEFRVPRVDVKRFGPDEGHRFEVRFGDRKVRQGKTDAGGRFEIHIPDIDLEGLHERLDVQFGDGKENNVFFFRDGKLDVHELHGRIQKDLGKLHEMHGDLNFGKLHEMDFDFGKLHELKADFEFEEIHEHLQDAMKNIRIHGLDDLKHEFRIRTDDFDPGEIHRHIRESMKGLDLEKGESHGMKFLIEIDADAPEGKKRGSRWSSKNGEEPKVWIIDGDDEHPHEHGDGAGIDWDAYDGSRDA